MRNGTYFENTTVTGSSFTAFKSYSMPNNANYWRVEVRDASNALLAMSEPIFFKKVPNMPSEMYAYSYSVTTSNGKNYTNDVLKGITSASYASDKLTLAIDALGASTTKVYCGDKGNVTGVSGATNWTYDGTTKILTIIAIHSGPATITVDWKTTNVAKFLIAAVFGILIAIGLLFKRTQVRKVRRETAKAVPCSVKAASCRGATQRSS